MMFIKRPQLSRGLSILESLVVLFTSLLLAVTLVPVILVQMGIYKLPEPEITPKPIVINGREVVGQKKPQPSVDSAPPPTPSPASVTPPPPAKAPESSAKPPVTSQSNKPPVPPMLEPAATSASTKP